MIDICKGLGLCDESHYEVFETIVPKLVGEIGTGRETGSGSSTGETKPGEAGVTTPAAVTSPAKVNLKSVKNIKGKKVAVKWAKIKYAKGYEVQYAMDKLKTKNVTANTLTVKKLKKGKTYYLRVRAYKVDAKGNKIYGEWSKTKKVMIKK